MQDTVCDHVDTHPTANHVTDERPHSHHMQTRINTVQDQEQMPMHALQLQTRSGFWLWHATHSYTPTDGHLFRQSAENLDREAVP